MHYPLRACSRLLSSNVSEFRPQRVRYIDDVRHARDGTVVQTTHVRHIIRRPLVTGQIYCHQLLLHENQQRVRIIRGCIPQTQYTTLQWSSGNTAGCSGEDPGSTRTTDSRLSLQLRYTHCTSSLHCLCRLSLPPSEGRQNKNQLSR